MLPLLFFLTSFYALVQGQCDGFYSCFKADLLLALSRITSSQKYTLLPELTFERRRDTRKRFIEPPPPDDDPSLMDIIKRMELVFKTHSLLWNILPGIDIKVSDSGKGNFKLGIQRCNHREEATDIERILRLYVEGLKEVRVKDDLIFD